MASDVPSISSSLATRDSASTAETEGVGAGAGAADAAGLLFPTGYMGARSGGAAATAAAAQSFWNPRGTSDGAGAGAGAGAGLDPRSAICPGGHQPLQRFVTESAGYTCDVCGETLVSGSIMFGCRQCPTGGYDECIKCYFNAVVRSALLPPPPSQSDAELEEWLVSRPQSIAAAAAAAANANDDGAAIEDFDAISSAADATTLSPQDMPAEQDVTDTSSFATRFRHARQTVGDSRITDFDPGRPPLPRGGGSLRFKVGDSVLANDGGESVQFIAGTIIKLWDDGNPYLIKLNNATSDEVRALRDTDHFVKAASNDDIKLNDKDETESKVAIENAKTNIEASDGASGDADSSADDGAGSAGSAAAAAAAAAVASSADAAKTGNGAGGAAENNTVAGNNTKNKNNAVSKNNVGDEYLEEEKKKKEKAGVLARERAEALEHLADLGIDTEDPDHQEMPPPEERGGEAGSDKDSDKEGTSGASSDGELEERHAPHALWSDTSSDEGLDDRLVPIPLQMKTHVDVPHALWSAAAQSSELQVVSLHSLQEHAAATAGGDGGGAVAAKHDSTGPVTDPEEATTGKEKYNITDDKPAVSSNGSEGVVTGGSVGGGATAVIGLNSVSSPILRNPASARAALPAAPLAAPPALSTNDDYPPTDPEATSDEGEGDDAYVQTGGSYSAREGQERPLSSASTSSGQSRAAVSISSGEWVPPSRQELLRRGALEMPTDPEATSSSDDNDGNGNGSPPQVPPRLPPAGLATDLTSASPPPPPPARARPLASAGAGGGGGAGHSHADGGGEHESEMLSFVNSDGETEYYPNPNFGRESAAQSTRPLPPPTRPVVDLDFSDSVPSVSRVNLAQGVARRRRSNGQGWQREPVVRRNSRLVNRRPAGRYSSDGNSSILGSDSEDENLRSFFAERALTRRPRTLSHGSSTSSGSMASDIQRRLERLRDDQHDRDRRSASRAVGFIAGGAGGAGGAGSRAYQASLAEQTTAALRGEGGQEAQLLALQRLLQTAHAAQNRNERTNVSDVRLDMNGERTPRLPPPPPPQQRPALRPGVTYELPQSVPPPVLKYTLRIFGKEIRTGLKRARLTQMLDQVKYPTVEGPLVVLLAAASSIVGFELVKFYSPAGVVVLWYVVAAAQYSLLKSVQPDPGSALLGERGLAFARAVHFVLIGSIAIAVDTFKHTLGQTALYTVEVHNGAVALVCRDVMLYVILALPFLWLFGHIPTWLRAMFHHILEQIDILMFGGGGSVTAAGAIWRFASSAVAFALCSGVCFAALNSEVAVQTEEAPLNFSNATKGGRFSVFCGLVTAFGFIISRLPSDFTLIKKALRDWSCHQPIDGTGTGTRSSECGVDEDDNNDTNDDGDDKDIDDLADGVTGGLDAKGGKAAAPSGSKASLAAKIEKERVSGISRRFAWDLLFSLLLGAAATVLHLVGFFNIESTAFATTFQALAVTVGGIIHYIIPELRRQYPWQAFREPLLREEQVARAKWINRVSVWGHVAESYLLWPVVVLTAVSTNGAGMARKFGAGATAVVLSVYAIKVMRKGFSNGALLWGSLLLSTTFFRYDLRNSNGGISEGLPLDMLLTTVVLAKIHGLWLRLGFAFTYVVPWNTKDTLEASTVVLYPLQFPHTAMIVFQCAVATLFAAPIYPVMGSAIMLVSYFRPIRFWERHFSTKRLDDTHTVSDPAVPRPRYDPGVTAKNLDSSHYRFLREMLEAHLSSAFAKGQWGSPHPGDIFVLTDIDNHMTAFVHIIDIGNGYVTFQLRGLEFSGTFCQMVELECMEQSTPDLEQDRKQFPFFSRWVLAFRAMTALRWRTWSSTNMRFSLPGYSVSRFRADSLFGAYDSRRLLLKRLTQAMLYYMIADDHLEDWLEVESVVERCNRPPTIVRDRQFASSIDPDYSPRSGGITFDCFVRVFSSWIRRCVESKYQHLGRPVPFGGDDGGSFGGYERLFRFCFQASVFVRLKMIAKRTKRRGDGQVDRFLHGYNALFRGDFSPCTPTDAWLFNLSGLVGGAIHSGVRMALILHQDDLVMKDEYEDEEALYDALQDYDDVHGPMHQIVCSETDPRWFAGIMARAPSMLSLRYNLDDSSENREFFVIRLTKRDRDYKIYKLNKEAVRGLWASQQQELLFFKNSNAERGSIQNAKTVLRNMVSQSCDEPVGYAIYVSEMAHSISEHISDESPWTLTRRMFQRIGAALHKKTNRGDATAGDEELGDLNVLNSNTGSDNSGDISDDGGLDQLSPLSPMFEAASEETSFSFTGPTALASVVAVAAPAGGGVEDAGGYLRVSSSELDSESVVSVVSGVATAGGDSSSAFPQSSPIRRLSTESDEIKPADAGNAGNAATASKSTRNNVGVPKTYDHKDVAAELGISLADALEMVTNNIIDPNELCGGGGEGGPGSYLQVISSTQAVDESSV